VVTAPTSVEAAPPPAAPTGTTEYTVVKGDYLEKIAKNSHVSVKAITDANPGIEPTKLKIGQKLHIPAAAVPSATAATGAATVESASAAGDQTYAVKSGDNLTKIAVQHGTTLKALRAANGLKTDSIKVGQKLKIPAKAAAPSTAPVAVPSAAAEPVPSSPTAPSPTAPPTR
jgi:peptidoglycan endopeptidase LytE